jgi:hypothetical protein
MLAAHQDLEEEMRRGIECCRRDDWDRGLYYLGRVAAADRSSALPGLYYSYLGYGIARCQRRVQEGLKLCRHSIKVQFYEPENYLNLARTCLLANERTEAVFAVIDGLKVDRQNLELQALHRELGIRRPPVLGFLARSNPLNLLLGRVRALFTPSTK